MISQDNKTFNSSTFPVHWRWPKRPRRRTRTRRAACRARCWAWRTVTVLPASRPARSSTDPAGPAPPRRRVTTLCRAPGSKVWLRGMGRRVQNNRLWVVGSSFARVVLPRNRKLYVFFLFVSCSCFYSLLYLHARSFAELRKMPSLSFFLKLFSPYSLPKSVQTILEVSSARGSHSF